MKTNYLGLKSDTVFVNLSGGFKVNCVAGSCKLFIGMPFLGCGVSTLLPRFRSWRNSPVKQKDGTLSAIVSGTAIYVNGYTC